MNQCLVSFSISGKTYAISLKNAQYSSSLQNMIQGGQLVSSGLDAESTLTGQAKLTKAVFDTILGDFKQSFNEAKVGSATVKFFIDGAEAEIVFKKAVVSKDSVITSFDAEGKVYADISFSLDEQEGMSKFYNDPIIF